MNWLFYVAGVVAVAATARAVTCAHAIHALLYLVVSLLAAAAVFLSLGAPFVAALEVVIYAGAIMVLVLFAVMILDPDQAAIGGERARLGREVWVGPGILVAVLGAELAFSLATGPASVAGEVTSGPRETAAALFGPYLLAVEVAGMMLLAGLVGAQHLGRIRRET